MATVLDASVGIATESTFATYATPSRFLEFTSSSMKWEKATGQGQGLRVSSRVARGARRVVTTASGSGDLEVEVASRGLGLLWQACLGSSTSTLVSAGTYQQVHTLGDTRPSLTLQQGVPRADATIDAHTWLGCAVTDWELASAEGEILKLKASLDAANFVTSQSLATVAYPAETVNLLHWGQGQVQLGGTLTTATATALASVSAPTAVGGIRALTVSAKTPLAVDRYNYGGGGRKARQIVSGLVELTGKLTVEYDATVLRDAYLADTAMPLLATWTGAALGTGSETLQIVLPQLRLDGALPEPAGELVTVDHDFTVLDNLVAPPIQVVTRTADTAL